MNRAKRDGSNLLASKLVQGEVLENMRICQWNDGGVVGLAKTVMQGMHG